MSKAEYTDTQRLALLASKGCVEIEDEYLGPIRVKQGDETLGKGKTLQEAIDMVLRRSGVKPAAAAIPNAEQIRGVLDGGELQFKCGDGWLDCGGDADAWLSVLTTPDFRNKTYRIKPGSIPSIAKQGAAQ